MSITTGTPPQGWRRKKSLKSMVESLRGGEVDHIEVTYSRDGQGGTQIAPHRTFLLASPPALMIPLREAMDLPVDGSFAVDRRAYGNKGVRAFYFIKDHLWALRHGDETWLGHAGHIARLAGVDPWHPYYVRPAWTDALEVPSAWLAIRVEHAMEGKRFHTAMKTHCGFRWCPIGESDTEVPSCGGGGRFESKAGARFYEELCRRRALFNRKLDALIPI